MDGSIVTVVIEPSQSMDILEDRYIMLGRKVASFLGFWPTQTHKERFFRSCFVGFSLLYGVLAQLCQLLTLDFNLRSIILVLQMFIAFACIVNIYFATILQFVKVQKLFSWIVQDGLQLKDEIEMKIMQKHINDSKLFPRIWGVMFCLYVSSCTLPCILRITLSTKKVISSTDRYPVFSCFDYFLGQEYYYYSVVIYQILTVIIMTVVGISIYSTYFWFIQHTCARLSIIKNKFHQPFINNQNNDNDLATPNDRTHWMIDIIQHLARTVQFMALMNKIGEHSYLFQVSLAFLLLVLNFLCLFQIPNLLNNKEGRQDVFAFILFISATIVPAYFNCYIGQKVMNYSTDVYRELCLIPIHEISLETQKLLLTMLMMSAKPCTISIGKVFVSSHAFFSELLRSSLSFAMVLRSTQKMKC